MRGLAFRDAGCGMRQQLPEGHKQGDGGERDLTLDEVPELVECESRY